MEGKVMSIESVELKSWSCRTVGKDEQPSKQTNGSLNTSI